MRLPLVVASEIRARQLIAPHARVLIALSGGPDSVALFHCMLELAHKRDLAFSLAAAHLHHGLRGKDANRDERFCEKLCEKHKVLLVRAYIDTPELAAELKKSHEETARIARHEFLSTAAAALNYDCVAVAHHADDRIETVLYRLCRGTGLAGLRGMGWTGPLHLDGEPDVKKSLRWHEDDAQVGMIGELRSHAHPECGQRKVVRPLLASSRAQILAYLKSKRQPYCTDETNFDAGIPRNALRKLVLPVLEEKVHPGTRAALWRLAEESEGFAARQTWRREWLAAFAGLNLRESISLPVFSAASVNERSGPLAYARGTDVTVEECADVLDVLRTAWKITDADFLLAHAQALQRLFAPRSGPKRIDLPSGIVAERKRGAVVITREFRA